MDGSSDWVPDIGRGRFPVRSTSQTDIMVDKYVAYANLSGSEAWLEKAAFIGTCDSGYYQVAEGTHNYVINNHTGPAGYTGNFPNSNQYGGDKLYCITYGAGTSDVRSAVNDGRWAVTYSGHGGTTSWGGPSFSQSDVRNISSTGVLPFVASHACVTGDFAMTECFGETWVLQDNKGALVFWGSSDSSYWYEDDRLERSMFDSLFGDEPQPSVTGMTDAGLAAVQQQYPSKARYYWETYNVLGDPSLKLNMGEGPGPTPTPTNTPTPVPPTPTPTLTPTPTPTPTVTPTTPPSTMHVDDIQMSYLQLNKVRYRVSADITIKDQIANPVDGATVSAQWTQPNGKLVNRQQVTGATGVASFDISSKAGTYQICVTDVTKAGWIYDPSQNVKTCETLTVP